MNFVEPIEFYDDWENLGLDDTDLWLLQIRLMEAPEAGDLIKGTGGARKLRFERPRSSRGKRGGARVIYVYLSDRNAIVLLLAYGKNVKSDITAGEKKTLKTIIADIKRVIPLKGSRSGEKYGKKRDI